MFVTQAIVARKRKILERTDCSAKKEQKKLSYWGSKTKIGRRKEEKVQAVGLQGAERNSELARGI